MRVEVTKADGHETIEDVMNVEARGDGDVVLRTSTAKVWLNDGEYMRYSVHPE